MNLVDLYPEEDLTRKDNSGKRISPNGDRRISKGKIEK